MAAQDRRLTVIDAGFPGHYRAFREALQTLHYQVGDVAAILLTHAHADHMGFAERVSQEANAPVFVHVDDQIAAQSILQLPWYGLLSNSWRPFVSGILAYAALNAVFATPHITKAYTFQDGDMLDVPGRPQVIHAPGHTEGEVVFHFQMSRILLSGDALMTRDLRSGAHGRPQLAAPRFNRDHRTAFRSLDRISELGEVTLLPGHGKPWQGCMADAVSMARQSSHP
jgi:glyoxylase-like metal-dependent hydrolase (beta-lactamase superfamily II)